MQQFVLFFACFLPLFCNAQKFLKPNEKVVFEFISTEEKRLLIAVDTNELYIICRFGSKNNIELEFPDTYENSWQKFQFSWYLRGGGIQNEGLELDYLFFNLNSLKYVVFQEYYSGTDQTEYGLKVLNLENEQKTLIKANPQTVIGSLSFFRDSEKIKASEEQF